MLLHLRCKETCLDQGGLVPRTSTWLHPEDVGEHNLLTGDLAEKISVAGATGPESGPGNHLDGLSLD